MRILFPSRPGERQIDPGFEEEALAAEAAGFQLSFVDIELNLGGDVVLRKMTEDPVLYRGWILKEVDYGRLAEAVAGQASRLVVPAADYHFAQDFPTWYQALPEGRTPKSVWFRQEGLAQSRPLIPRWLSDEFREGGLILKDFLKSRKHEWYDACFIRDLTDEVEVRRVMDNFVERQTADGSFVGGLVFREFVPLKQIGIHTKSRMPLVNEWRAFFWFGQLLYLAPYWSEGADYDRVAKPSPQDVERLGKGLGSKFYALDVAELEDGSWIVVELNDGGTAGVPEGGDYATFYAALWAAVPPGTNLT
jgi:hypothetical protein